MVTICRTLTQDPPSTAPDKAGEAGGRTVQRASPQKVITIDGQNLAQELISTRIQSLVVEETARGLSWAEIVVQNDRLKFTDVELIRGAGLNVEIFTGYGSTRLQSRGKYKATVPKYAFRNSAMPLVKLKCFGQEWPLMVDEERRIYENLRDSEIAAQIAQRHGLSTDIEQTSTIYEHVMQPNMTDMEFLENRALMYGYDVYVEEGVLHFHPPRFVHSGLNLVYSQGEVGVLNSFRVEVDPWMNGVAWTNSGLDRLTGKEWEFTAQDTSDDVSRQIQKRAENGFTGAAQLAEIDGNRPRRYVVGEGHEQTEGEGRRQVEGFGRATEWIVQGSGHVRGIELMKARSVVTIGGVGHLNGDYYVSRVRHEIKPNSGYTMQFEVMRPGVGRLIDKRFSNRTGVDNFDRRNVTDQLPQAGEVSVG